MKHLEILNPPQFSEEIYKVEEEEFITAEIENEIKRRLLNNDIFLKKMIEEIRKSNYLVNPDFKIASQINYYIKKGCTIYNEPKLLTDVSNLGLSDTYREVTYITDTHAGFLGDDGYTYYVSPNDIEKKYFGANVSIVDGWHTGGYDTNVVTLHDDYITIGSDCLSEWEDIFQEIRNIEPLRGQQVTYSVKLRSHAEQVLLRLRDSEGEEYSHAKNTGDWEMVSLTRKISDTTSLVAVGLGIFQCDAGTLDIAWAKLEIGERATLFVPPNPEVEKLKCNGYSERNNDNYILNPNFRINQKGEKSYSITTYHDLDCVDKWKILGNSLLEVKNNGVIFTKKGQINTDDTALRQIIENSSDLEGKPLTFSIQYYKDGVIKSASLKIPSNWRFPSLNFPQDAEYELAYTIILDYVRLGITAKIDRSLVVNVLLMTSAPYDFKLSISSAKLEIGEKVTPFIIPNPEIEKLKCDGYAKSSNPNILINPNFSINQRDGYITKVGVKAYYDADFTSIANESLQVTYRVTDINDTYAMFLGGDGTTKFYIKLTDIEKGYTGGGSYTVDRWRFNSELDANILKVFDTYITLMNKKPDKYAQILQLIDDCHYYSGKTLTFSAKIRVSTETKAYLQMSSNNKNHAYSFIGDGEWKIVSTKITLPENVTRFYVGIGIWEYSSGSIDIEWAKLEEGDIVTPFVLPHKSEELLKCKYYYQEICSIKNPNVYTPNGLYCNVDFSEMRIMPTAYFKNSIFNKVGYTRVGDSGGNLIDGFTFSIKCETGNEAKFNLAIIATKNNHGLNSTNSNVSVGKGNRVCLDAEKY